MSSLYTIRIISLEKEAASVIMNVKTVHPDAMRFHQTAGFALQLLDNGKWSGYPIGSEISYEEISDDVWCKKYAKGFIKEVKIIKTLHTMPSDAKGNDNHPFFRSEELWPEVIFKIQTTDQAWLEHLSENEEWESTAFDVSRQYDDCEPILFRSGSRAEERSDDQPSGWMPIPNFLFDQGSHSLPNVLLFPRFTNTSYVVDRVTDYSQKNRESLRELHGKYIRHIASDQSGIFVWNDLLDEYRLYTMDKSSSGIRSFYDPQEVGKIGHLSLRKDNKRHFQSMTYSDMFRNTQPSIRTVDRKGSMVALELLGVYDIDILELNKIKVLKMICNNFVETYGYRVELDSDFPLSKLLKYFVSVKKDIYYPSGVLPLIADGIIMDYKIEYPDQYIEDYDAMDEESLFRYFEEEAWPCFKIHIELSDEAFGLQLDHVTESRFLLQLKYMPDDFRKIEQPILWSDFSILLD